MKINSKLVIGVGTILFLFFHLHVFSDTPPDPPGGGPGGGDLPVGGSAPLFGGTGILISLALSYLAIRLKTLTKKH